MPTHKMIIVEDQTVLRQLLQDAIEKTGRYEVIATAADGEDGLNKCKALSPDVILLDMFLPKMNGQVLARKLREEKSKVKIFALSSSAAGELVRDALRVGVDGFWDKASEITDIIAGLDRVMMGETPALRNGLGADVARARETLRTRRLTTREMQVLKLLAEGNISKEIAAQLCLSTKTVEHHRARIGRKLGIHDVASLTRHAIATGIVTPCGGRD